MGNNGRDYCASVPSSGFFFSRALCCAPVQLALRVSSTSVTVITSGAGRSITSTATVSTAVTTGCSIRRAAFFTSARFGLALATVCFAAFARRDLRAFPDVVEFPLRSFPRFCSFDFFLRLAMIHPCSGWRSSTHCVRSKDKRLTPQRLYPEDKLCIGAWIARRWRRNTHGDHWCNQKQSHGLTLASQRPSTQLGLLVPISLQELADQVTE